MDSGRRETDRHQKKRRNVVHTDADLQRQRHTDKETDKGTGMHQDHDFCLRGLKVKNIIIIVNIDTCPSPVPCSFLLNNLVLAVLINELSANL